MLSVLTVEGIIHKILIDQDLRLLDAGLLIRHLS